MAVRSNDAAASESGPDVGTYNFVRNGSTAAPLTVYYWMTGKAIAGSDYAGLPGTVTFATGSATATLTLTPINDAAVEGSETATLTLALRPELHRRLPAATTITIADDDTALVAPTVTVSASDPTATEAGPTHGGLHVHPLRRPPRRSR